MFVMPPHPFMADAGTGSCAGLPSRFAAPRPCPPLASIPPRRCCPAGRCCVTGTTHASALKPPD